MDLPFPSMDPYLEASGFWPDVHHRLMTVVCDQLLTQLQPHYTAVITPYVTFESLEIAPIRLTAIPDIAILETDFPTTSSAGVAVAPAPLTVAAAMEVPTRYARLEIRTLGSETLVTAIELLSPVNKRLGTDGADTYERKRQEIFRSTAHLLEIDLLRAGKRPQTATPLPDAPYFIFLSRAERRPLLDVWPLSLRTAIPLVPVPLSQPDPDIVLDLGSALHQTYQNGRYERRLNYRADPPPPELSRDDSIWLDNHLRQQGLRS
jgi:hypothetical protein